MTPKQILDEVREAVEVCYFRSVGIYRKPAAELRDRLRDNGDEMLVALAKLDSLEMVEFDVLSEGMPGNRLVEVPCADAALLLTLKGDT